MAQVLHLECGTPSASATQYGAFFGPSFNVTEANAQTPCPAAGTLDELEIELETAPGAAASGKSLTFTLRQAGAGTGLTLTFTETEVGPKRVSVPVSVSALDLLDWECVPVNTPTVTQPRIQLKFTGTSPNVSIYGQYQGGANGSPATIYAAPFVGAGFDDVSSAGAKNPIAISGDVIFAAVRNTADPGVGNGLTFTWYKSTDGGGSYVAQDGTGGTPDSRVACINTQQASASFALPIEPGHIGYWQADVSGSFTTRNWHVTCAINADAGAWQISGAWNAPSSSAEEVNNPVSHGGAGTSILTETTFTERIKWGVTGFDIGYIQYHLTVAPGGATARVLQPRKNAANVGTAVTISGSNIVGNGTSGFSMAEGDVLAMRADRTGSPAGTFATWAIAASTPIPGAIVVTQMVLEVFDDEFEDLDDQAACTGDGEVAQAVNPDEGVSLATTTAPLYWMEVTLNDGSPATVYRWAGMAIPYGEPKEARVLRFGTLTRALSDIDGGFESASITSELQDLDRVIRTAWNNGTLRGARVDYFCADLATLRAGGEPDRRFRGYISRCEPSGDLTFRLTVEDALTNRLNAIDAQDLQVPTQIIEDRLATLATDRDSYDKPAPHLFGSITDEFGAWECPYVGSGVLEGQEELGVLDWFLVSLGVVKVNEAFLAGLGVTADIRVQVAETDYAVGRPYTPQKDGWIEANDWSERDGRRWTLVAGSSTDPAIQLAKDGTIPLVVNVCGLLEDQSLSSSPNGTINSPPRALLIVVNNYLAQDATDDWLPILMDGDVPIINTVSFEAVHDALEAMADTSFEPAIAGAVGNDWTQRSWRDRVAEFFVSHGFDGGIDHNGSMIASVLDLTQSGSVFSFTPDQILAGSVRFPTRLPVENEVRFVHTENYLTPLGLLTPEPESRLPNDQLSARWLSGLQVLRNEASITALGGSPRGRRRSAIQEYTLSRNAAQSTAVAQRRLDLLSPPNGRIEVAIGLSLKHGCDLELGQVGDAEHWDLPWTGSRRCRIHRLEEDMDTYVITPTLRDVDDLLP